MKQEKISYEIITNEKLTNFNLANYVFAKSYCNRPGGYYTFKTYVASVYGDMNKSNRDNIRVFIKSFNELNELGLVKYERTDMRNFTLAAKESDDQFYGTISIKNFDKIIRSRRKCKYGLIRFMLFLSASMNHSLEVKGEKNVICSLTENYFATKLNISVKTVCEYVKALEEMKIIYVKRPGVKQKNVYSLYENKEYVDYYVSSVDINKDI